MDEIRQPGDFQVRDIESKIATNQVKPPKKRFDLTSLFSKKNLFKTIIVIIIIVILLAVAAIIWGRQSFSRAKVDINIKAIEDIASGDEVSLTINYKNKNRVNLNDAYLIIDYPSGTFSSDGKEIYQEEKSLGTIFRKSQGEETFKVRFVGEKGDIKNLTIKLNYRPQNINSRFENSSSFRIEINTVLIGINIEGSEKTIPGQEVNYLIEYKNNTDKDVFDLKIELVYPDDFEFKNADPSPEEIEKNNIWQIDTLEPNEKKIITLQGILSGEQGENKILKATIGRIENNVFLQYSQSEHVTQISPSPLVLDLKLEGIEDECKINPGQTLNYKIEFRNNTEVALQELILKLYFQDKIFDFTGLDLGGIGFFNSRENVITWSGAEVPGLTLLEPNQSGKVNFSIEIKKSLPIFSYNDKNFQAKVLAEIETLTVPAEFSVKELKIKKDLTCKINSELDLKTKVYYYEPGPGIINIGPVPPGVDKLTTYTVHWQITNTSNDLENVKVNAFLPQGISWQNYYINKVSDSNFYYNERTKEIVWEISKVPAGTGITLPMYEIVFQIGLRPSVNQIGQTPTLINESSIEGKDTFTEKTLKDFTPEVNTTLPDDPRISSTQGRVIE